MNKESPLINQYHELFARLQDLTEEERGSPKEERLFGKLMKIKGQMLDQDIPVPGAFLWFIAEFRGFRKETVALLSCGYHSHKTVRRLPCPDASLLRFSGAGKVTR